MSLQSWIETLTCGATDGPTLTSAASASCIPVANRIVLPANYWSIGKALRVQMSGRISCAVTTPGTARLDLRLGASGTTIVFDTGALNLNTVAKTNVPWFFDLTLVCRAVGTGTNTTFMPTAYLGSEAIVGAPLPSAGGNGLLNVPVGAPAVGAGCDNSVSSPLDIFFTQNVATGSFTVNNYLVQSLN